jgi:hypothetical protein
VKKETKPDVIDAAGFSARDFLAGARKKTLDAKLCNVYRMMTLSFD